LDAAELRDPKGLYKKARAGEIKNFTGIDDPYEAPQNPEIHLRTDEQSLEQEVAEIIEQLQARGLIPQ
jgi:adenylylsulfate kinase